MNAQLKKMKRRKEVLEKLRMKMVGKRREWITGM
jgi:hypothetical protein